MKTPPLPFREAAVFRFFYKLFPRKLHVHRICPAQCAPLSFFSSCRKERQRRARWKKEKAPNADNVVQRVRSYARISNSVRVWYKVHGESPRRPQCCLDRRPRAAGRGGEKSRSEVRLSVSGMRGSKPRLTALAATPVPPLDSPPSSGVQRTLPLVAFLEVQETFFPQRERMCLDLRRFVPANTQLSGDKSILSSPALRRVRRRGRRARTP